MAATSQIAAAGLLGEPLGVWSALTFLQNVRPKQELGLPLADNRWAGPCHGHMGNGTTRIPRTLDGVVQRTVVRRYREDRTPAGRTGKSTTAGCSAIVIACGSTLLQRFCAFPDFLRRSRKDADLWIAVGACTQMHIHRQNVSASPSARGMQSVSSTTRSPIVTSR